MNINEEERRARLLKSRAERLPDIKKQFEEAQKRNFNSNFQVGGKDERLVKKSAVKKVTKSKKAAPTAKKQKQKTEAEKRKVNLSVSAKKGDMMHHQRMLSADVNAQATQHIIGIPVNKSRYNGYGGEQVTNAKLKSLRPDPEAVRMAWANLALVKI